eukprot:3743894-Rhodomonas_salina.2
MAEFISQLEPPAQLRIDGPRAPGPGGGKAYYHHDDAGVRFTSYHDEILRFKLKRPLRVSALTGSDPHGPVQFRGMGICSRANLNQTVTVSHGAIQVTRPFPTRLPNVPLPGARGGYYYL